jgi:hypothetical protein
VEDVLERKISAFPKLTNKQLFELVDIAAEIESIMKNDCHKTVFAYYLSSSGVNHLVCKLPPNIQKKWTTEANSRFHVTRGDFVVIANQNSRKDCRP